MNNANLRRICLASSFECREIKSGLSVMQTRHIFGISLAFFFFNQNQSEIVDFSVKDRNTVCMTITRLFATIHWGRVLRHFHLCCRHLYKCNHFYCCTDMPYQLFDNQVTIMENKTLLCIMSFIVCLLLTERCSISKINVYLQKIY